MTIFKIALLLFITLTTSLTASGHSRFLPGGNTPGRNNDAGIKSGPCGGLPKMANPTIEFQEGQTIKLQWEETINHPGRFEFSISNDNDQSFQLLLTVPDTQDTGALPHRYEADLKLPDDMTCNSCTLQMIQQMTENPNNPRPYFSCSDIRIVTKSTPTPDKPIDETKNTPTSTTNCH